MDDKNKKKRRIFAGINNFLIELIENNIMGNSEEVQEFLNPMKDINKKAINFFMAFKGKG